MSGDLQARRFRLVGMPGRSGLYAGHRADSGDWGVCRPAVDRCRGWPNDDCPLGEACVSTPAGRRCRDYRDGAQLGAACVEPSDCRIGQICVIGESGLGACRAQCDANHPCEGVECQPLEGHDTGFCPGTSGRRPSEESEAPSITGF
ncbi:MAG: hypothetical protein ABEN55_08285 [Bradymonadaceae bacterium]